MYGDTYTKTPGMIPRRRFLSCLALSLLAPAGPVRAEDIPVVAAASDMKFALAEAAAAFRAATGQEVRLAFGSTGNLATQIREGAPFQLFLAADESFVAALHRDGLTRDEGRLFAEGRLAVMAPHGSALRPDPALDGLATLLREGRLTRFAIANPDHAPYGMRAREALQTRGLWEAIQPFLVLGENVAQAAQFALSGNAEGGLIAHSLALAEEVRALGDFALVPADWHAPLRQRMVLLRDAGPVATAFHAWLQGPGARAILSGYGFTLPAEG